MSYRYSDNECMHSDALFFDAVHLKMNLMQGENGFGPKHVWDYPGVELLENGDVHCPLPAKIDRKKVKKTE